MPRPEIVLTGDVETIWIDADNLPVAARIESSGANDLDPLHQRQRERETSVPALKGRPAGFQGRHEGVRHES
ncbi:MAG: hypothetical protein ACLQHL_04845 [Candidatus Cybelea sp.]|jgi:hypothetical protein